MNQDLKIALIQQDLIWENKLENLQKFDQLISNIKEPIDLILLPEMFSTGFTMRADKFAETMDGNAVSLMKKWANEKHVAVAGSLIIKEVGKYYNRFVWVEPNGEIQTYDKAHLFRMGEEQLHFSKGLNRIIISYKGWKIAPFICYDLRFPVWIRKSKNFDYDLLLFSANWPERRKFHWNLLLQARAIENQSYVAAVNRIGIDGNGMNHSGDSQIISPLGEVIYKQEYQASLGIINLSKEVLVKYRETFPVGLDADTFEITN
ncbi:MAG: amidohydrolase [Bacteroidia bacterium]|nr:amidohydrolase [Bacteroidia bacterium]MCF8425446.1 amidohydrolase [Bacteroidia bacterium]MCF8446272.1 amidohydrolase [Bacteroidia bacterium]